MFEIDTLDLFGDNPTLLDAEPFSVTLDQRVLVDALTAIGASIASRSTLPILGNVKLEGTRDGLYLHTTDLESYSIYRIPADVASVTPGAVTVNYKELLALVKPLKGQVLRLSQQESVLAIEASGFSAPLSTMDAGEYPAVPSVQKQTRIPLQTVTVPVEMLRRLVNLVWYAAAEDLSRPVFTAVCMSLEKDTLELVACDAYRLSMAQEKIKGAGRMPFSLLIPAKQLHEVLRKMPKFGDITITTESNVHTVLTCGPLTVYMRLVEGVYPNYKMIIPQETELTAIIDGTAFQTAMKSVEKVVKDNSNITTLHLNGSLEVKAQHDGMEKPMSVHVPAETTGKVLDIKFNWQYLNQVLAVNPGKQVQFDLNDEKKPARVTFPDMPGFTGVLMPMHANR